VVFIKTREGYMEGSVVEHVVQSIDGRIGAAKLQIQKLEGARDVLTGARVTLRTHRRVERPARAMSTAMSPTQIVVLDVIRATPGIDRVGIHRELNGLVRARTIGQALRRLRETHKAHANSAGRWWAVEQ
jgi:hypothetical protein